MFVKNTKPSSLKPLYFAFLFFILFCFIFKRYLNVLWFSWFVYIFLFYFEAEECNICFVIKITNILFDYNL